MVSIILYVLKADNTINTEEFTDQKYSQNVTDLVSTTR